MSSNGIVRCKAIGKMCRNLYYCIKYGYPIKSILTCDIDLSLLPPTTTLSHPFGIVICHPDQLGYGCVIQQGVTIGRKDWNSNEYPTIGNNVKIGANAVILGDVNIGDNVIIGANSVVLLDVPNNMTIVGVWKQ